eukprot:8481187-Pyramimonas_sp.AAC.1
MGYSRKDTVLTVQCTNYSVSGVSNREFATRVRPVFRLNNLRHIRKHSKVEPTQSSPATIFARLSLGLVTTQEA